MRRKRNSAIALDIQKENWEGWGGGGGGGSHAFFRGNKALIWTKIRHALLCILRLLRIIVA